MAFKDTARGREYYRQYRETHREQIRERDKRRRAEKADQLRESQRRYRGANRDTILARQKAYRDSEAGRAYHAAYSAIYYASGENRMRMLVNGAILRAKRGGLEYDLALRDLLMANPPTVCACCGRELDYSMGKGRNKRHGSPSLDRFNCRKGYTVENTRVICMRCNSLKSDATLPELEAVVAYMKRG